MLYLGCGYFIPVRPANARRNNVIARDFRGRNNLRLSSKYTRRRRVCAPRYNVAPLKYVNKVIKCQLMCTQCAFGTSNYIRGAGKKIIVFNRITHLTLS